MEIVKEKIVVFGTGCLSLPLRIYEKLKDLENEIENFPFVEDHEKARITGRQTFEDFAVVYNKVNITEISSIEIKELQKIQPVDYSLILKIKSPTNPYLRTYKTKKRC